MMVCSTDLATPTREAVSAEQRAAQRNCEYVRREPENTRRTKVGKKPAAKMEYESVPSLRDVFQVINSNGIQKQL